MKHRMKKISLLVFHSEKQRILEALQDLGVVHLTTRENESLEGGSLQKSKQRYQQAIDVVNRWRGETRCKDLIHLAEEEVIEKCNELIAIQQEIERLTAISDHHKREKEALEHWGDIGWEYVDKLEENGFHTGFYVAPKKEYYRYDFGESWNFLINEGPVHNYFIVVYQDTSPDIPFEAVRLPRLTTGEVESQIETQLREIAELKERIILACPYLPLFEEQIQKIEDQLNFETASGSFSSFAEGLILHINGWFPANEEPVIKSFLEKNDLSYIIEKPTKNDQIPVILRNRRYSSRFESITRMFQLPDYHEFDLTPAIAVFYPVFFGYCLGDAGYGIILAALGAIARSSFLKKAKYVADLIIILGVVSIVLGIIKGGAIFGISIFDSREIPVFNYLSQFILIPDDPGYILNSFNVALMVGLFQIILGVIIAIIRKIRYQSFLFAVSTIGKLLMIIGAVTLFLGAMQEVDAFAPFVGLAWGILIAGTALVLLFHNPDVPLLRRIGSGALPVYFIITGLLGDTLSYIRLFALGVSSSILGIVVNQIGSQIMSGGSLMTVLGILFLMAGHCLNLAIAALGSFVHPLRLTFVEFYNNAEFKGGGLEFKAFKKQSFSKS